MWGDLESALTELVGEGQVLLNRTAGTVHVESSPAAMERVREFISTLKRRATTQVSLEARILEVRLSDEYRMGVNWSLLPGLFETTKTGLAGGGAIVAQTASAGGSALTFGFLEDNDISLVVDALEGMGQVRVLSSPRVATMNNVPATLNVVDRLPVIDREIIDSQGGLRTQFDVRFVDAGVSVSVTPQIGRDGMITARVAPQITEQTGTVTTPDGLQTQPILSTRSAATVVRVADGQAIVIGGLRSTRKDESTSGVSFLAQIPLLGQLFRSTVQTRSEVELMVILVPRTLDSSWLDESVRRGSHRLITLRRPFRFGSIGLDSFRHEDWSGGSLQGTPVAPPEPSARLPQPRPVVEPGTPGATITREGLANRLLERAQHAIDRHEKHLALAYLDQAIELAPRHVTALVAAGVLLTRDGRHSRAVVTLDQALSLAPTNPFALVARGNLAMMSGAPHAAATWLRAAHEIVNNAWTATNYGAALLLLGEFEAAKAVLRSAATDAPPELFANLAFAELQTGERATALKSLERALASGADPRNPRIHALMRILGSDDLTTE